MGGFPLRLSRWAALALLCAVLGFGLACEPGVIGRGLWPSGPVPRLVADSPLYVDPALAAQPAVGLALSDLAAALGQPDAVPAVWDGGALPPGAVLVVAPDSAAGQAWGIGARVSATDESYWIGSVWSANAAATLVSGQGARGPAYGVFRLADLVATQSPLLAAPLDLAVRPAFTFRLTGDPLDPAYPAPAEALRRGYNAVLIDPWPDLVLYDRTDPRIFDAEAAPDARAWVEAKRAFNRDRIAEARRLGVQVVVPGDFITLPKRVAALYGEAAGPPGESPIFCLDRPVVQHLLAAGLDEVLTDFPDISAVLVRTGENYAAGYFSGNPPHRTPGCPADTGVAGLRGTIDLVRSVVVDRHGKQYIQRGWDLGATGSFHADPAVVGAVTAGLPAGTPLFSFKHTQTDFWRYNDPNPNLFNRRIDRMVEIQIAREYEGKGAFPNYLGDLVARGAPEARTRRSLRDLNRAGVQSAWVWPKGGGWGGPVLADDLWLDASRYAIDHLLWEPDRPARELALAWATREFGAAAAPSIAALLEQSPEIVRRGLYPDAAGRLSDGWAPHGNWVRDDRIAGAAAVLPLYTAAQRTGQFQRTLADSAAARQRAAAWAEWFAQAAAQPGAGTVWQSAAASLAYQATLQATLDEYLAGLFYFFRWQDGGRQSDDDSARAAAHLRAARENFARHQATARAGGFATPYQDAGFLATVEGALREIGG